MRSIITTVIASISLISVALGQSIHSGADTTSRNFSAGWYRLGGANGDYYIIPKTGNAIRFSLPKAGTSGQILRRTGTLQNAYTWQTPGTMIDQNASAVAITGGTGIFSSVTVTSKLTFPDGTTMTTAATGSGGGGGGSYSDDEINGFLLATDRLIDVRETGGMGRNQGYFHQVIARRSVAVGGVAFKITRGGSVSGSTYQNAVGLFDTNGNLLAIGDAASSLGSSGWKKVMFTASYNLVAGQKYVIGLVANGDDIPNFAAVQSFGEYNQYIPASPLRNFRKSSVSTLNTTMNFAVDTFANTDSRIFLSLVAP